MEDALPLVMVPLHCDVQVLLHCSSVPSANVISAFNPVRKPESKSGICGILKGRSIHLSMRNIEAHRRHDIDGHAHLHRGTGQETEGLPEPGIQESSRPHPLVLGQLRTSQPESIISAVERSHGKSFSPGSRYR